MAEDVPDFTDRDLTAAWFRSRPTEDVLALLIRSVLRSVPIVKSAESSINMYGRYGALSWLLRALSSSILVYRWLEAGELVDFSAARVAARAASSCGHTAQEINAELFHDEDLQRFGGVENKFTDQYKTALNEASSLMFDAAMTASYAASSVTERTSKREWDAVEHFIDMIFNSQINGNLYSKEIVSDAGFFLKK